MHCGFMDSRLRRFPPDRASAVPYGQTVGNATRCPPLAHRSAAAHKLHSAQSNRYKIRESQNQIPGTGLSLFLPGDCPNDRDHRRFDAVERPFSADITRSSRWISADNGTEARFGLGINTTPFLMETLRMAPARNASRPRREKSHWDQGFYAVVLHICSKICCMG